MSQEHKQILEVMKRRDQDIDILQLLLKHNLTRKRAEHKLLIMYLKVCNMISKARLRMLGIDNSDIEVSHTHRIKNDIRRTSLWDEHFERLASDL